MNAQLATSTDRTKQSTPPGRGNWPLRVGGLIVALVVAIALLGPLLAPNDPLARTSVLQLGDQWVGPPYPALTPGFPLGSDSAGRDLFSRLLWGVRPTLLLVTSIAFVRLLIGISVGLVAGWSTRWVGHVADQVTRAALLAPVLIVALATIAFVGVQRGLLAFMVALCLTGWADSARFVESQTRTVRGQPYIEAAQALGAGNGHVLVYHILRQILPLAGMLFAQEVSSTLMTTAALGFLGYYIGGGVWIIVGDFTATSAAGMPELGQMLATALEQLLRPWAMVVVGGCVVVIVLGFNLLGEGLRRQLQLEVGGGVSLIDRLLARLLEQMAQPPFGGQRRHFVTAAAVFVLLLGGGWWLLHSTTPSPAASFSLTPAGDHAWVTARHDPYGTLEISATGPISPAWQWIFTDTAGFSAGPAVDAAGDVYVANNSGKLYALTADGVVRWSATLPAPAVGAPALGPDGAIYVVDHERGLSALERNGSLRWRFVGQGRRPSSGPIVGSDGVIYYSIVDRIQAVNPDGRERWVSDDVEAVVEEPPRLSPNEALIFLRDGAFATDDGTHRPLITPSGDMQYMMPTYAVGGDGQTYYLFGSTALLWQEREQGAKVIRTQEWDLRGFDVFLPADGGVSARQTLWLFYSNEYTPVRIAWISRDSKLVGNVKLQFRSGGRVIGVNDRDALFVCGALRGLTCMRVDATSAAPAWSLTLATGGDVAGGAVTAERLYVTTQSGLLAVAGDAR